jgi:hypothetical protein
MRRVMAEHEGRGWPVRVVAALLVLALLPIVLAGTTGTAGAASNGQWSVFPADGAGGGRRLDFEPDLAAGHNLDDWFVVTNQTDQPLHFALYAADAFTPEGGGFAIAAPSAPRSDLGGWLALPIDHLDLDPHRTATVPFAIITPVDAAPGDHAGAIVVQNRDASIDTSGSVAVSTLHAVAVRVYCRVAGDLTTRLAVSKPKVHVDRRLAGWFGGPVDATVTFTVTNVGNQRLQTTASAKVGGWLGGSRARSRNLGELLPGAAVPVTMHVRGVWPTLRLHAKVSATASGAGAAASRHRWVLPWALIALLIAGALIEWRWGRRSRPATPAEPSDAPATVG